MNEQAFWKAKIQYLGRNFWGWQRQKDLPTVQSMLESVLSKIFQKPIKVHASGRTDAKVNALGQHISFSSPFMEQEKLLFALNSLLPSSIRVLSLSLVKKDFHARYSAIGKTYIYLMNESRSKNPFFQDSSYTYSYTLDKKAIEKAMKIFVGKHNFISLKVNNGDRVNPVREIFFAEFLSLAPEWSVFVFCGSGFMYKMLRVFVGLLLSIGEGKLDLVELKSIIHHQASYPQKRIVDPQGLFLFDVYYSEEEKNGFLKLTKASLLKKFILESFFTIRDD